MLKKLFYTSLVGCLLTVVMSVVTSCSDADYVSPDQVDARVDARWNELAASVNQRIHVNEMAIARLDSLLRILQEEQKNAYDNLMKRLDDFASKDYAEFLAEQARLAAIDAAKELIENALKHLSGTGEYVDLSGIENDINKLKEADAQLTTRIIEAEARMRELLSNYATKADVASLRDEFLKNIAALHSSLSANIADAIARAEQAKGKAEEAMDEVYKARQEIAKHQAEIEYHEARLTSLEETTKLLSQRLDKLEGRTDNIDNMVINNLKEIERLHTKLDSLATAEREYCEKLSAEGKEYTEILIDELRKQMADAIQYVYNELNSLYSRLEARLDELTAIINQKSQICEKEIARLDSLLLVLQKEQEESYDRLLKLLEDFATKDYAEFLAEQARLAAIEAAKELIANALANLSGSGEHVDLTGIENDIDKLKETDSLLTIRIIEAEARIYQLVNNFYTKEEIDNIIGSLTTCQCDLSSITQRVDEAMMMAEVAMEIVYQNRQELAAYSAILEEHNARLESLENTTALLSERLKNLQNQTDSLGVVVANNLKEIENLKVQLADLGKNMKELYQELQDRCEMYFREGISYTEKLFDELRNDIMEALYEMRERTDDIEKKLFDLYDNLYSRLDQLVTSIVYQGQEYDYVYAHVKGSGYIAFPYAEAKNVDYLEGGSYNIQEKAGFIYATVNPSAIDATWLEMSLENSLGNTSYYLTPDPSKAEAATGYRLTRASSRNGLWKIPVKSITHTSRNPLNDTYETDMLLALKATYWSEKSVYSQYAATWEAPQEADVVMRASISPTGSNYTQLTTTNGIRFTSQQSQNGNPRGQLQLQSGRVRVYRKYVECVKVLDIEKKDITDSLCIVFNDKNSGQFQKVFPASDDGSADLVDVICPKELMNNYFTLRYYLWNYDGTIVSQDLEVIFSDENL